MGNKMRWVMTALCAAAVALSACGAQDSEQAGRIYVGVTYYDQNDTFLSGLLECFKEELAAYGSDTLQTAITIRDAGGSQRRQDDRVEELIEAGCNVLCVNLVDRLDPSTIIDLATEHNVPIIFFNREPVREDMQQSDSLYYVGAHAEESGVLQGELAADYIEAHPEVDRNKDGVIQYAVLEGEAGHQDAIIRTEKVVETLTERGIELEKLDCQIANWSRAQAQNRTEQMVVSYRMQIELLLANNDDMALGAIDAYDKLSYTADVRPAIFGIDGTDDGLAALAEGKLQGTVYNDKEGQAQAMAQIAAALVTGEGMDAIAFENGKYVYIPYRTVEE